MTAPRRKAKRAAAASVRRQDEIVEAIIDTFADDHLRVLMGACIDVLATAVNYAAHDDLSRRERLIDEIGRDVRRIADFRLGFVQVKTDVAH